METLEKAFLALQRSIGWLAHPESTIVKDAITLYFKSSPTGWTISRIGGVLELCINGMNSGKLKFKTDNTSVRRSVGFFGDKPEEVELTEGYVRGVGTSGVGSIHVTRDYIMNNRFQAVRTFIHEATHRFASTQDFGEQGYMEADGSAFREAGITPAQCLLNADSYAYFCMRLGYR